MSWAANGGRTTLHVKPIHALRQGDFNAKARTPDACNPQVPNQNQRPSREKITQRRKSPRRQETCSLCVSERLLLRLGAWRLCGYGYGHLMILEFNGRPEKALGTGMNDREHIEKELTLFIPSNLLQSFTRLFACHLRGHHSSLVTACRAVLPLCVKIPLHCYGYGAAAARWARSTRKSAKTRS